MTNCARGADDELMMMMPTIIAAVALVMAAFCRPR